MPAPTGPKTRARPALSVANDKRSASRRPLELAVRIATVSLTPGLLADVSQTGARLKISSADTLPDEFLLVMNSNVQRWCRTMWRSYGEAGVQFVNLDASETMMHIPMRKYPKRK